MPKNDPGCNIIALFIILLLIGGVLMAIGMLLGIVDHPT